MGRYVCKPDDAQLAERKYRPLVKECSGKAVGTAIHWSNTDVHVVDGGALHCQRHDQRKCKNPVSSSSR